MAMICKEFASKIFQTIDRKSTRLNSSHSQISYAVFCFKQIFETVQDPEKTQIIEWPTTSSSDDDDSVRTQMLPTQEPPPPAPPKPPTRQRGRAEPTRK